MKVVGWGENFRSSKNLPVDHFLIRRYKTDTMLEPEKCSMPLLKAHQEEHTKHFVRNGKYAFKSESRT